MLLPGDADDAPRPGASLRAAARQSRKLLIAIGVAIAALVSFGVWTAAGGSHHPSGGASTSGRGGAAPGAAGPRGMADGVPVGYADTQPGAVAAAVNYEMARSRPDYITDQSVRHTVLGHVMSAAALPAQITSDDANAAQAMQALGLSPGGQGPNGASWIVHSAPLGVQVTSYSSQVATVNVWMAEIAGVVGDPNTVLPPSGSYTTYALTLSWQSNDWKIASIATHSGPVPTPSSNQSPSSQQDWQQSGTFDPPPVS
jgi:hypothetical protein